MGLRARKLCARSLHAEFHAEANPVDAVRLLRAAERGRIAKLLAVKHERMAASPFGYFRGSVPVMAADLAAHPRTEITTQLCGDAHVSNLGAYAALDGRLVFDINDFDETICGPFEWDLKRLATSILLAGREAGIKRQARRAAVLHMVDRYRESMHLFSAMPVIELARYQIHRMAAIDPMPQILDHAERSTPPKLLKSLTEPVPSQPSANAAAGRSQQDDDAHASPAVPPRRFRSDPPTLQRLSAREAALVLASLESYLQTLQPERRHFLSQYEAVDVAFKVVGTGSVGLRDYCVYLEGIGRAPDTDPLFLQIKEEPQSAYAAYLPQGDSHAHQGHRVMDGQRAMQLTSDPFLGFTTIVDERGQQRDYLVRQLNDHKASLDLTKLDAASLLGYADLCGELFARGHARAGDPVSIAAYLGTSDKFDHALLRFARSYADKTEQDYELFCKAMKSQGKQKR